MRSLIKIGLLGALMGGFAMWRTEAPYQGFAGETFIEFPRGTGTGQIADKLAEAGVVRSRWDFLLARLIHRGKVLQAAEDRLPLGADAGGRAGGGWAWGGLGCCWVVWR